MRAQSSDTTEAVARVAFHTGGPARRLLSDNENMLQQFRSFAKQLRVQFALQVRPSAILGRSIARTLALFGVRFQQTYYAWTDRLVENELAWISRWDMDKTHLFDLMSLYPAMQRVFFIHIPKCGGTSIRQILVTHYGVAPVPVPATGAIKQSIEFMSRSAPRRSLQGAYLEKCTREQESPLRDKYLKVFVSYLITAHPDRLFILGHKRARELQPLYRQGTDLIFTTVRAPVEILRSMVLYRVSHTLKNPRRPDSLELLAALQLDFPAFTDLVTLNPQELVGRILEIKPPSLASYLAMDSRTEHDLVWQGIKERSVYIAHVTEQSQMLTALFGRQHDALKVNASESPEGVFTDFSAAIQDSWIEPLVDVDSAALYQRLQAAGIIGFWKNGGTAAEYRDLLEKS